MKIGLGIGSLGLFQTVLELLVEVEGNIVADLINQTVVEIVIPVEW